ncbi:probable F-box protein At4g22165 [Rutidosis leptorrhynchoides]|uniref:probable F-box protein At4g22165 n=1 Tax=Rutidosis leptorrhynchoides TaxID=125765 RepID=UPI003A99A148
MDWSEAFPELLDVVAQKYMVYYEDYLDFSGVCKFWHSIAAQAVTKVSYSNGLPSRLPSLFITDEKEDVEFRRLFFLSNRSTRKIRLPEVCGKNKSCISSSGWLLTVEDYIVEESDDTFDYTAAKLINPISRETIDLPKIDTCPGFVEHTDPDSEIRKVLFSIESPVVVVSWGRSMLGYCCIGDRNWTAIETDSGGMIFDITCYDGRVYYLDNYFRIRSCDVYGEDPVIVDVSQLPRCFYNIDLEVAYIIGLDDVDDGKKKLLVVIRELLDELMEVKVDGFEVRRYPLWRNIFETKSFHVFEYDLENGKWSKVNGLGKKTLFVGFGSSFWIEDTSGMIKSNCIYYTDHSPLHCQMLYRGYKRCKTEACRDMGIYHMCDRTIEPLLIEEKSCSNFTPPMWLQSM